MSAKTQTVGFSISGEFMTDHSRNLWAEGGFAKAFRILECLIGSTREQQEDILFGRKKLIGVNSLNLVPDNWTPPDGYCPSMDEALRRGENWNELTDLRSSRTRDIEQARQAESDEEDEEPRPVLDAATMARHHMKIRMELAGFDTTALATPESMMNRGYDIIPKLDSKMESVNGWLLPDGKYYGCGAMEHVGLASKLIPNASDPEKEAEHRGWVKLVKSISGFSSARPQSGNSTGFSTTLKNITATSRKWLKQLRSSHDPSPPRGRTCAQMI